MSAPFRLPRPRKIGGFCRYTVPALCWALVATGIAWATDAEKKHVRPAAEEVFGVPVEGDVVQGGRQVSRLPLRHAGGVGQGKSRSSQSDCASCSCAGCTGRRCGRPGCLHCKDVANRWSNCDCDGSYKFPVPPLYTYHWPGVYSLQRVTDYHSPWRFPPLRPYAAEPDDETLAPGERAQVGTSGLVPASWSKGDRQTSPPPRGAGVPQPLSEKMLRHYGETGL